MSHVAELRAALVADAAAGHCGLRLLRAERRAEPCACETALVSMSFDSGPLCADLLEL